jgi:outer membrane receptor protein involved in Fe transport
VGQGDQRLQIHWHRGRDRADARVDPLGNQSVFGLELLARLTLQTATPLLRALRWGVGYLVCVTLAIGAVLDVSRRFNIPAGDATQTLKQFSRASGVEVLYPVDSVRGVRTNPVVGQRTAREALQALLAGTGLIVVEDELSGAVAVRRPQPTTPPNRPAFARMPAPILAPIDLDVGRPSDELVRLNPFEVRAAPPDSYDALDSNSLTAFRIDLAKLPATTSVFTQAFMEDAAATSIQDVLIKYAGTVGADPNNSAAALSMPGDRDGNGGGLGIRGLSSGPPKRDGLEGMRVLFRSPFGYIDNFSTERIEVIEGPQSLLYGAAGGGGVVNIVSKRAQFDQEHATLQARVDQYASKRAVIDANYGGDRLALRVAAAGEQRRNVRFNLGNDFYGLYVQAAVKLGPRSTLRLFSERDSNWGNIAFTPSATDLGNFLAADDPRRGQDVRYLALTHQLDDLGGVLGSNAVDYDHISSLAGWWSSERIDETYSGMTLESVLGHGFSAQLSGIYSETIDDRFVVSKNLVPPAGSTGAGANPFSSPAIRFTPSDNWQSDRTRAVRFTLLHEVDGRVGPWRARSQTAFGIQGSHQGPAFASSGIDRLYYQADENWQAIISPTVTTDYGRVPIGNLYIPLQSTISRQPAFRPGSTRITINGQNYVLQPRIQQDPARVTDQNPFGLVPNNPTPANPNGFSGQWNRGGETHDHQWFLANFTDWADGRLTTMAGLSVDRFTTLNSGPGNAVTYLAPRDYVGFQLGVNYRIEPLPALRVYANFSTADQSAGTTKDFYGRSLRVPSATSVWPEIGLKYNAPSGRLSAQLAFNPETKVAGETRNAGADFFNAVNPAGINGHFNSGDQWVNVDRVARSLELVVTASPSPNWRIRFSATHLEGEITSTVSYAQLYNDQFYARDGLVTYKDGTPVLVDPAAAGGAKTTPLTLAMINDPTSAYFASPDQDSGRITRSALITALTAVDPLHGSAATGVTGLPISEIQYGFANPHRGEITVVAAGDKTTGINEYSFNLQNRYAIETGRLRGLSVFVDFRTYLRNRAYYTSYFPPSATGSTFAATRVLYRLPNLTEVGLGLAYRHRLGSGLPKLTWTTRLNVENVFDNSRVWVVPSRTNGAILNARLSAQPRTFIWSNTIAW